MTRYVLRATTGVSDDPDQDADSYGPGGGSTDYYPEYGCDPGGFNVAGALAAAERLR